MYICKGKKNGKCTVEVCPSNHDKPHNKVEVYTGKSLNSMIYCNEGKSYCHFIDDFIECVKLN